MKSARLFAFGLMIVSMICADANAQFKMFPFAKTKAADTQASIQLTQKAGPWLIMCASFTGEDGRQQALRLTRELRESHKIKAYIYSHHFDFEREVRDKGLGWQAPKDKTTLLTAEQQRQRPKQMRPAGESQFEEIAVLVGDFASIEDAKAQRALAEIKTLQPKTMVSYDPAAALSDQSLAGSRLRAWRDFADSSSDDASKAKGPLRAAFLMPNPMLPDEYFQARTIDEDVLKWNSKPKYSLLDNPSPYSVQIATFDGESTFELDEMEQKLAEDQWFQKNRKARTESKLDRAVKRAHILTMALRKQGIEAYEFHDRYESYVCVGSFDWLVRQDANGRKIRNPEMVATIQKFKGKMVTRFGQQGMETYKLPDKLVKGHISCDVQPLPVLIPKAPATYTAGKKKFGLFR